VPGLSGRIRVRSVVGRFLEHSRVWYFRNGGDHHVYVGSADLIPRNLDQRVEVMAPLKDKALRHRALSMLEQYMADDVRAHELRADGTYVRTARTSGGPLLDAHLLLAREPIAAVERREPDVAPARVGVSGPHWAVSLTSAAPSSGSAQAE
jgi:polyphosphate kinase